MKREILESGHAGLTAKRFHLHRHSIAHLFQGGFVSRTFLIGSLLGAIVWRPAWADTGVEAWVQRYNRFGDYTSANPTAVATGENGGVIVTGYVAGDPSLGENHTAFVTIKYAASGSPLWTNLYSTGLTSYTAVALDDEGSVIVAASGVTIKYSSQGEQLWINSSEAGTSALAVDRDGNVFITGTYSDGTNPPDYLTIKYSNAGLQLWTNRYNCFFDGHDYPQALAVDSSGSVLITGYTLGSGFSTIKYSSAGTLLWTNRYQFGGDYEDRAVALVVDHGNNVIVAGQLANPILSDYVIIKYSNAGAPLWTNRYNAGSQDWATALVVDGDDNVFVTGASIGSGTFYDYATIKYSSGGVPLWTNRYTGPSNGRDEAYALAVDGRGDIFVTGRSVGTGGSKQMATVKYSNSGVPLWTNRVDNIFDQPPTKTSLAIDRDGAAYVVGAASVPTNRYEFAVIKYVSGPAMQPVAVVGDTKLMITWTAVPGQSYQLQHSTSLNATDWMVVTNVVAGGATVSVMVDTPVGDPQRFYRVLAP